MSASGLAVNGYGDLAGLLPMVAALVAEVVLTTIFLLIIMGSTDKRGPAPTPIWPLASP